MITKVTITGADDSINPGELIALTNKFPFVEWGILVSGKQYGNNRFPSKSWLSSLEFLDIENKGELPLSCHLCGQYVRDILLGKPTAFNDLGRLWEMFKRVQINTHGIEHNFFAEKMGELLDSDKEFIFQYDNANSEILEAAINSGANCSTLFDLSHGAGALPAQWPLPFTNIKCGYAGGLSPQNLDSQIQLIESKVGKTEIWIDMETHVRSNNDKLFDLSKVEKCLEISSKYIQG